MLKNFRKKLGEIIKIVFGRNSATRSIMPVERKVFIKRIKRSEFITGLSNEPSIFEKTNP
jgi:hypothetical protein